MKKYKESTEDFRVYYYREFCDSHHEGGTGPYEGYTTKTYSYKVLGFSATEKEHEIANETDFDQPVYTDCTTKDHPDQMYCVYVVYSDGGTFGRTTGYGHIAGLYKDPVLADSLAKLIINDDKSYEGYKPWVGYFSNLESVEVELIGKQTFRKTYKKSY